MKQNNEIMQLRNDLNNLKEIVENLTILMNRKLIKELHEEVENIEAGQYLTEGEFEDKHKVKIH